MINKHLIISLEFLLSATQSCRSYLVKWYHGVFFTKDEEGRTFEVITILSLPNDPCKDITLCKRVDQQILSQVIKTRQVLAHCNQGWFIIIHSTAILLVLTCNSGHFHVWLWDGLGYFYLIKQNNLSDYSINR